MNRLEEEVCREMLDGVSSSVTQRKVFQFLVNDLEKDNENLMNELSHSRNVIQPRIDDLLLLIQELRTEVESINTENQHLHETVVFLGNQLNRRMSCIKSTSSMVSEESVNSSIFLEEMLEELQLSKHEKSVDDQIDNVNESHSQGTQLPLSVQTSQFTQTAVSLCHSRQTQTQHNDQLSVHTQTIADGVNELVDNLTENIELKDKLIERLETKIDQQNEQIKTSLDTNTIIAQLLSILQNTTAHHPAFSAKTVDTVHAESIPSDKPPTRVLEVSNVTTPLSIEEQLTIVRKQEHSHFLAGNSCRKQHLRNPYQQQQQQQQQQL